MHGAHGASHQYLPVLTGQWIAPTSVDASSPRVKLSLHSIGGFCAMSDELPPNYLKGEHVTTCIWNNGLNPHFSETVMN